MNVTSSSMSSSNDYEYVDKKLIDESLLCPICTDPFEDPVCGSLCGHTFCRKCITDALHNTSKCPSCRRDVTLEDFTPAILRPFLNQLNQLFVICRWCSQMNIPRGNFKDHLKSCSKIIVSCPAADIKCDWKGQYDKMQDHVRMCPLVKVQPMIVELNALIKQQSEQIRFLYTILEKTSKSHQKACQEHYKANGRAYCDICRKRFMFDEHKARLHYCPDTDFCSDCVKKHFP